ncbi:MAG: DUF5668 domain-containing protein [Candidatus Eisenbacteria bacterium]
MKEKKRDAKEGIFWGVLMVALGVVFLLAQRELIPRHLLYDWWHWWPAILIGIGLVKLVRPGTPEHVGSGVSMILFGVWFFANQYGWYGLDWHNSWPLALVAVGAGMMAKAIAVGVMRGDSRKEEPRG